MVSSSSPCKRKTLDPAARDFIPGSHEGEEFYYRNHQQHSPNIYDTYRLFPGALTNFPQQAPPQQPLRMGFPAPPSSLYEWQAPQYIQWPANEALHSHSQEAFHSQTQQQAFHSQHEQVLHPQNQVFPYNQPQQTFPFHGQQHHQVFHRPQAFHSQQQHQLVAASGHDNQLQLQQHYAAPDHYQLFRLTPPPPLLQAPVLVQNYAYHAWEPPLAAPALGQPAYPPAPAVTLHEHLDTARVSGSAQPFIGRDRMSRALQLIGVPTELTEAQLAEELSIWGEIRALQLARHSEGLITVHYFDLRSAKSALTDIQNQHLLHQQRVQQLLSQDRRSKQIHASPSSHSPTHDSPPLQRYEHFHVPPTTTYDESSDHNSAVQLSTFHSSTPQTMGGLSNVPSSDLSTSQAVSGLDQVSSSAVSMGAIGEMSRVDSSTSHAMASICQMAGSELSTSRGLVGGKAVWAHYTIPVGLQTEDCLNQGTLVVFNLDASMQADVLRTIFERYGTVKEVREAPLKRQHKFVEFYDIRHAAVALQALDGTELGGKKLKIEFSRPGGNTGRRSTMGNVPRVAPTASVRVDQSLSTIAPNMLMPHPPPPPPVPPIPPPSLYWQWPIAPPEAPRVSAAWPSHSSSYGGALLPAPVLPHSIEGYAPPILSESAHAVMSTSTSQVQIKPMMERGHMPLQTGRVIPPRQVQRCVSEHTNTGEAREGERARRVEAPSSSTTVPSSWKSTIGGIRRGAPSTSAQSNESFRFDESEAESSGRTTLMIRNIPNKYTQEMLITMLDDHCMECNRGACEPLDENGEPLSAFDFVYLPIDFKNRCNLGYAFVNLTSPQATRRLHKAFHGRQWDEFNSRKICEVSYARLQGREALEDHFKNSRFVCDMDEYLPVKFDPPRSGRPMLSTPDSMLIDAGQAHAEITCEATEAHSMESESNDTEGQEGDTILMPLASQADQSGTTLPMPSSTSASTSMAATPTAPTAISFGITLGRRVHGYRHAGILQHHEP